MILSMRRVGLADWSIPNGIDVLAVTISQHLLARTKKIRMGKNKEMIFCKNKKEQDRQDHAG